MELLKVGVIGTGHMGKNHVRNLAMETRYFDLIGIYDQNPVQAGEIAKQYAVTAFNDMEALLDQVDAVVIAVPSSLHRKIGLAAAEHNVHALIEKPLATTVEDAMALTKAFHDRGLKLAVGHIERFNAVIKELKKIVNPKEPFYLEAHRYSPFSGSGRITDTSVVEDLMIHDIDLVCHLLDDCGVKDVHAAGEQLKSNNIDFASCMLHFNNQAHAVIHASRVAQNKERTIRIHTLESYLEADLLTKSLTVSKNTDLVMSGPFENSYTQAGVVQKIYVPIQEPLREELVSFYQSVVHDEPLVADGAVGLRAVQICEEVVKKIKQG